VHFVRRAKWREKSGKFRNAVINNEISEFSLKSANDCVLRVAWLVSTSKAACTTFGVLNGVKRALNFELPQSGTNYQSFRQNRRMAAFCELQGLYRRGKRCALRSACYLERKER
jgi:hypothetical protein